METVLQTFEKVVLAIILGGGIGLASNMRPNIMRQLQKNKDQQAGPIIERISIDSWNSYNRSALWYTILFLIFQVIRWTTPLENSLFHLLGVTVMLAIWLRKLAADKNLKARTENEEATYVTSADQQKGHREVEVLSKALLVITFALFISPV